MKRLLAYAVAALGVAAGGLMNAWLGYFKGGETGEAWSLFGLTITVGPGLLLLFAGHLDLTALLERGEDAEC